MKKVYLLGLNGCGLGNCLFQIAAAIYYCEKYNYTLELMKDYSYLFGTSNMFGKSKCKTDNNNNVLGYDTTIFKKLFFISQIEEHNNITVHNDYTDNKITPNNDSNIIISGFNQNVQLFKEVMHKLPKYFHLYDDNITNYIYTKYGDVSKSIAVGIRIGNDFKHMTKLQSKSYVKALDYYKQINENTEKVYIISDTPNIRDYNFDLHKHYNCIEVNESDIVQFYFGLLCKNYILSESTFHLWIAYLGTTDTTHKRVICFNDTDITNRKLELDNWIKIDY
jgi:hypothetical protein